MKRLSQLLALTLALVMALGLAACGGTDEPQESGTEPDTAGSGTPSAETYVVGICQQMTHDALDAATQGFKDALIEKLGADAVKFKEGNASGEYTNCATIVDGFIAEGVDLILANATYPLQASRIRYQ